MGVQHTAVVRGGLPEAANNRSRCHNDTGIHIAVAVEIFRGAVDDGVEAERDRVLVDGRGECVVNDRQDSTFAGDFGHGLEVHTAQHRVRRRLDVYQAGVGAKRCGEFFGRAIEGNFDAKADKFLGNQLVCASVKISLKRGMIARLEMREKHRGNRRHA